jgi:hypothetical protein
MSTTVDDRREAAGASARGGDPGPELSQAPFEPPHYWFVPLKCFIGLFVVVALLLFPPARGFMHAWLKDDQSVEAIFGRALFVSAWWAFVTNREERAYELDQEKRELEAELAVPDTECPAPSSARFDGRGGWPERSL